MSFSLLKKEKYLPFTLLEECFNHLTAQVFLTLAFITALAWSAVVLPLNIGYSLGLVRAIAKCT